MIDWAVVSLGALLAADPVTGVREERNGGQATPFVPTGAVSGGSAWLDRPPAETTADPRGRTVQSNDLLLVARGVDLTRSIRCSKIAFEAPATFSESLVRLRVNPQLVDADYLRLFLTSRLGRRSLASVATGAVIPNLPQKTLVRAQIRVPDLNTQRAIAARLLPIERSMMETTRLLQTLEGLHDVLRESLLLGVREPVGKLGTP